MKLRYLLQASCATYYRQGARTLYMHSNASSVAAQSASAAPAQRAEAPEGGPALALAAAFAALFDTNTAGSAAGLGAKQAG